MTPDYKYPGEELALFENASNWKRYFSGFIAPLLQGNVLEAGAGIGATTLLLNKSTANKWILLEPDQSMYNVLLEKKKNAQLPANCVVTQGTLDTLNRDDRFDVILYIDVLEHIEKDGEELNKAAGYLLPGGHIIVLSPAFPFLYSPFDKAIGHYRRYTKAMLKEVTPAALQLYQCRYLDSFGYFASLANKLILHRSYPTQKQVMFWDKYMVPVSKITDPLFFYSLGKSILAIWKKPN